MRKSVATVALSGMLPDKLEAAAVGFDGVEVMEGDLLAFEGSPADVMQALRTDVMQALGTDLVLVCSITQPAALDDDARVAADLLAMAERAASRGLRMASRR